MKKSQLSTNLFELNIFGNDKQRLLEILQKRINSGKFTIIFTPNPEQIVLSQENRKFLEVLQKADILIPDGIGLVWASRKIKERIAGRELVEDLLKTAKDKKLRVLVVGGRNYEGLVLKISNIKYQISNKLLKSKTKNLIYWIEDYENAAENIKELKPDIVFVALGAPKQEYWIDSHRELLEKSGVKIAMSVGGSFDYLLGKVKRVPKLVSKLGLEWLFRLVTQPFRWRRQLKLIKFISLVFTQFPQD